MPSVEGLPDITDEEEARIQAGIARDPDNPELTDEQMAQLRPAREVLPPELFAAWTRSRPPADGSQPEPEAEERPSSRAGRSR